MRKRVGNSPEEGRPGAGDGESTADDLTLTAAPSPGGAGSGACRGPSSEFSGRTLAHFEMLELVGSGGFGEVYRARDRRLDRIVAIKILPQVFAVDAERRERFRREAVAASALNHPHICTVHELVGADGHFLIVMELVEGQTLHERLKAGPLPVAEALPIAIQIADALGEAHRAGILHRDVKCRNIALTKRGQVKVLDFGLAKLLDFGRQPDAQTLEKLTAEGTTAGTPGYMSPEQLLARPLDGRSDLFSFGVVLYRMVTGRLPFEGTSGIALADAILNAEPHDFGDGPIPEKLKAIIRKLLQKNPDNRYACAEEVEGELKALDAELAPARRAALSRTAWAAVAAGLVLVVALGGWSAHRWSRQKWALEATAEITRLVEAEEFTKAVALIREARAILPKDPTLEKLWLKSTFEISIETVPSRADVSIRPYVGNPDAWESLGKTPLSKVRVSRTPSVFRYAKERFVTRCEIGPPEGPEPLDLEGSIPADMERVPAFGGAIGADLEALAQLPKAPGGAFLIDRTEVTNEAYKRFVEAGGYEKRELWKQDFVKDGRTIPWEEAVARFRDATGRPGPATWDVGTFPKGLGKHPVAGVSWYEAAAYAEFVGKRLPTVYHWAGAAGTFWAGLIVPGSNFRDTGTVPVGGEGTLGTFATYDMAGNVKEWCWNEGTAGKRFILGGGYGEPPYMFIDLDAQSPWERRPNYGFRCVKLDSPPSQVAAARIDAVARDFVKEKPASEEVFTAFRGLYSYDRKELDARVEEIVPDEFGTREKVSFNAAYGDERVIAYLYLPENEVPPYQTVVFFPGSSAIYEGRFRFEDDDHFFVKSGRALMFPLYKGTFERRDALKSDISEPTAFYRDHMIAWSKDLGRAIDYLETRKDIQSERLAYYGISWGAEVAPVMLAVERRFKTAILTAGGLPPSTRALPEADEINFVPQVRVPVLMLNGRYDAVFPVESSQVTLFRLLGTPEKDKRHVIYESGHFPPRREVKRETLDWLDRYLGPVKR